MSKYHHSLSIEGDSPTSYKVLLDGEPIKGCKRITIDMGAVNIPKVTLELDVLDLKYRGPVKLTKRWYTGLRPHFFRVARG